MKRGACLMLLPSWAICRVKSMYNYPSCSTGKLLEPGRARTIISRGDDEMLRKVLAARQSSKAKQEKAIDCQPCQPPPCNVCKVGASWKRVQPCCLNKIMKHSNLQEQLQHPWNGQLTWSS